MIHEKEIWEKKIIKRHGGEPLKSRLGEAEAGFGPWKLQPRPRGSPRAGHALLQQGANRPSSEAVKGPSVFRK